MNYPELKSDLLKVKNIVITTHRSPDGDAIGSSVGLMRVLKSAGYNVELVVPDAYPNFLAWMTESMEVLIFEEAPEASSSVIEKADLWFALDYNHLSRVGALGKALAVAPGIRVMIDHHIDPDQDFQHILSDTSASSTAELVFDFVNQMGWIEHVDEAVASCLYAGIMTDTGSFKFSSTSAHTHRITAELIDRGLKPTQVHERIFDHNSLYRLRLLGYALSEKLSFYPDQKLAVISLSHQEKNRFHYQKGDTEGLVNYGLSIEGSDIAVFLSEENGFTKFSFRSKAAIDVNLIAREHFNGGGHKNAAGGKLDLPLAEALKVVSKVFGLKNA